MQTLERKTSETQITCKLALYENNGYTINTGLGFLDHMLEAFAKHSQIGLEINAAGDLHIDDHHTVEDVALTLGEAIHLELGNANGIARYGYAYAPMDEALSRAVIDLSGRPASEVHLTLKREKLGDVACENFTHFFRSLAIAIGCSIHIDVLRGENDHHKIESAFKALALALRMAIQKTNSGIPSTKGVLYE